MEPIREDLGPVQSGRVHRGDSEPPRRPIPGGLLVLVAAWIAWQVIATRHTAWIPHDGHRAHPPLWWEAATLALLVVTLARGWLDRAARRPYLGRVWLAVVVWLACWLAAPTYTAAWLLAWVLRIRRRTPPPPEASGYSLDWTPPHR